MHDNMDVKGLKGLYETEDLLNMINDSGERRTMLPNSLYSKLEQFSSYRIDYSNDIDESAVLSVLFQSSYLWGTDSELKDIGNKYLSDLFLSRAEDKPFQNQLLEKIRKRYLVYEGSVSPQLDIPKENHNGHKTHQLQCTCCGSIQDVQCPFPWKELTALRSSNRKLLSSIIKLESSGASHKCKRKGVLSKKSKNWRYKPYKLTPAATSCLSQGLQTQDKVKDMVTRSTSTTDLNTIIGKATSTKQLIEKPAAVTDRQPLATINHINVGSPNKKRKPRQNKCENVVPVPSLKEKNKVVQHVSSEKTGVIPKSPRVSQPAVVDIPQFYAQFLIHLNLQLQMELFKTLSKFGSFCHLPDLKSFWDENTWEIIKMEGIYLPGATQQTQPNTRLIKNSICSTPDLFTIPIFKTSQSAKIFGELNELPVPYVQMSKSTESLFTSVLAEFKVYELFISIESPDFGYKQSLLEESFFSKSAKNWEWLKNRYGVSPFLREEFVWKHICKKLDSQTLSSLLTRVKCSKRVIQVALEIADSIHFLRFEEDNPRPVSELQFVLHSQFNRRLATTLDEMVAKNQSNKQYVMTNEMGTQSRLVGIHVVNQIPSFESDSFAVENELNDDATISNQNWIRKKLSVYSKALEYAWQFIPKRKPRGLVFHSVKLPHKVSSKNTPASQKLEAKGEGEGDEQPSEESCIPAPVTEKQATCEMLVLEESTYGTNEEAIEKASSSSNTKAEANIKQISGAKDLTENQPQFVIKKKIVRRVKIQTEKHLSPTFDRDQETSINGKKCRQRTKKHRK